MSLDFSDNSAWLILFPLTYCSLAGCGEEDSMAAIAVKEVTVEEEEEIMAIETADVTAHQIGHGIFLIVL